VIEPLRFSLVVGCDAAHAFETRTTRVEIEHRGWDRLGAEPGSQWRDANVGGWNGVLPVFARACDDRLIAAEADYTRGSP
jgi:hypothetical protein